MAKKDFDELLRDIRNAEIVPLVKDDDEGTISVPVSIYRNLIRASTELDVIYAMARAGHSTTDVVKALMGLHSVQLQFCKSDWVKENGDET